MTEAQTEKEHEVQAETEQPPVVNRPGAQAVLDMLYRYALMVLLSAVLMSAGAVAAMIWMRPLTGIDVQNAFLCIP